MDRFELERIYKKSGLNNYKLTCLDDLKNCHGIDALQVKGYEDLTEKNKEIYKKFIINYFNGHGMDTRMVTTPKAINYVENIDCIAKDPDDDKYIITIVMKINTIKNDGTKKQLHKYINKRYKDLKIIKESRKEYLRFEFKEGKTSSWLHVTDEGRQWY